MLVADAGATLLELSGGQFELTHDGRDFAVVDHADADSVRPVRTLSGGETFQASLALALALSAQLAGLAAGGTARLDAIVLDEGFGTLDEATLDVVASTLESLAAGGDRMVGVVTHVGALAERVPVRFAVSRTAAGSTVERRGRMKFWVDAWDPAYGTSPDQDPLGASPADTDAAVERPADRWRPVPAPVLPLPPAVHFVDGVRRVDAHVWIEAAGDGAVAGCIAASYAAGVVSCRPGVAGVDRVDVRRGLFTSAPGVPDLTLAQVTYRAEQADGADDLRLSNALQGAMADAEAECALTARTEPDDLLVLDGPLGKRGQLARVLGMVKTHRSRYLPPELHALVAELGPAERTPVFRLTSDWPRYSWYLRLPCRPGAPWSGVVRVECPDVGLGDAVELAELSQAVLPRYASAEHKDPRAPQNLYPIGGLERLLRRRLGDRLLLERALRTAAAARELVPV